MRRGWRSLTKSSGHFSGDQSEDLVGSQLFEKLVGHREPFLHRPTAAVGRDKAFASPPEFLNWVIPVNGRLGHIGQLRWRVAREPVV